MRVLMEVEVEPDAVTASAENAAEVITAARALLPPWVPWAFLVYLPIFFALSAGITWLCLWLTLEPLWRSEAAPWHERARLAFPRVVPAMVCAVAQPMLGAMAAMILAGPLSLFAGPRGSIALFYASLAGALTAYLFIERRVRRRGLLAPLAGLGALLLVLFPAVLVLVFLAAFMPPRLDVSAVLLLLGGALALVSLSCGGGLVLARALGLLRPASARTLAIVEEASRRTGIRPAAVWDLWSSAANAMAFPTVGGVAFTTGALDALDEDELVAVAVHELEHLTEPFTVTALRVSAPLLLLPLTCWHWLLETAGGAGLAAVAAVALLGRLMIRRVMRLMEERADRAGRRHESDHGTYARALERLYEENLMPAVMSGPRVHPHLYDRMRAAGVEPAYPRPEPPSRLRVLLGSVLVFVLSMKAFVAVLLVLLFALLVAGVAAELADSEGAAVLAVALSGEDDAVVDLADWYLERGERERAAALCRVALLDEEDSPRAAEILESIEGREGKGTPAAADH